MPKTYQVAGLDVKDIAAEIRKEFYTEFDTIGVTIDYIFAYGSKDEEGRAISPACTNSGYPDNGETRILGLKDRTVNRADAEIVLDGDIWGKRSREEQKAIIDHELFKLVIKRNSDGDVMFDDMSRPKLKIRQFDRHLNWFQVVAERHGEASVEVTQAHQLVSEAGQIFFPFVIKSLPKQKREVLA